MPSKISQLTPASTPFDPSSLVEISQLVSGSYVTRSALLASMASNNVMYPQPSAGAAGIQAAINSLAAYAGIGLGGGGVVQLGAGVYQVGSTSITPADGVVVRGLGMGVSVVQQTTIGTTAFALSGSYSNQLNYLAFEDFTVLGTWLSNQSLGGDSDRAFNINGVKRIRFSNIESLYCREMAITAGYCNEVIAIGCRTQYTARDSMNFSASRRCIVINNYISNGNDDAIAIHQEGAAGNPPIEGHVISGNVIEDCYGIKCLGISKATISNNTMRRMKGYGVYTEVNATEGYSDSIAVNIFGNSITDIINGTFFGTGNSAVGILVGNATKSYQAPVVGGATPDINYPESFYYLSNNASNQNAGAQGINIYGNTIAGFTLPAGLYSAWGFGLPFTAAGIADVNLTSGFKFNAQGIRFIGAVLSAHVSGNIITGTNTPIVLDSTIVALDYLKIVGNTLARFSSFGVDLETGSQKYGRVFIENNTFDGDPYFESSSRTSPLDGTWNTAALGPAALDSVNFAGITLRGNTFRNLARITHQSTGAATSYEGNTYYCQPSTSSAIGSNNAANAGIYSLDGFGNHADRFVWEDSNPTSATYGQELGRSAGFATAIPSAGSYLAGQFVRSAAIVQSGTSGSEYTILGWQRLTTNVNAHVKDTDWREMHCLTGN